MVSVDAGDVHSELEGDWIVADYPRDAPGKPPRLHVRSDGTFDFGAPTERMTFWVGDLRQIGDRSTGGYVGTETHEVVWCDYSPRCSTLYVRSRWQIVGGHEAG